MYLRVQKLYLVNNVLENPIWAVPLLLKTFASDPNVTSTYF